jgi:O-antigen/teichoic acid export membrane protein/peptidoglycan/xylan/chitin deacetylase (PgdA/CDA1 family)
MSFVESDIEGSKPQVKRVAEDLTGRSRLARNVLFSWGGYLVNVISGFIMPRMISDHLGQTTLGIWDFSWSVVSYFGLVQLGLGGSVDRYVAKYRAVGDNASLSRSVSSIGLFLKAAAMACAVVTLVTVLWILPLFRHRLGAEMDTARWVVLFLGLEITLSLALTVYGAVIVGCHRWDIHNSISACSYAVIAIGMIVALLAGGGLPALALVHLVAMFAGDLVRWRFVGRVCPELRMHWREARWSTLTEQARYSAKNLIPRIADLASNQSLALLIATYLGPAALAVYSRPRNLMRQFQAIAAKFGYILIPTASSLQAQVDKDSLRHTFYGAGLFIVASVLPVIATLALFGDTLIQVWMGKGYVYAGLMPILAVGCLPTLVQEPIWSILSGMNRHGHIALGKLVAAVLSAALLWLGLAAAKWSLIEVALVFALPQMVIDGVVTPFLACRRLEISLVSYYRQVYLLPLFCVAPYLCCLLLARRIMGAAPVAAVVLVGGGGGAMLLLYWTLIVPEKVRGKLGGRLRHYLPWKSGLANETAASDSVGADEAVAATGAGKRIVVVFRNDDPSADMDLAHETEIFGLFERYGVPQTLAVIPNVCRGNYHDRDGAGERRLTDYPEAARFLDAYVKRTGSEIALHGLTHRTNRKSDPTRKEYFEFCRLSLQEQSSMIAKGTEILAQVFGSRPTTFVPPWNRLDQTTVKACADNGYACISAGVYLRTGASIMSFGHNTDIAHFAEDYTLAKRSGRRVFLNLNFHSRTVRSREEKEVLRQNLEMVSQDSECEVLTITQARARYRKELEEYNEAGLSIAPLYSVPGCVRSRAWVYVWIFEVLSRANPLTALRLKARQRYADGDYAACREFNGPLDRLCRDMILSARTLAGVCGGIGGTGLGMLRPLSGVGEILLQAGLGATGVCLGLAVAHHATTEDTRKELATSVLISALVGAAMCVLVSWSR